ncbi:ABC transporter ATP-binding protein [Xylanimonas ulmi]|uniref:Branched-chain amino acid transport system ATP-binding protein n=1 Tax=Xylanimonas ulmi TaxID=228973 RepID=A0A4Q7M4R6_9MICO|nr:ABC transporter ATP-binding protein [Xylanibacterium ulmi]RZS61538.1 branched-chain amino acid transport system ATP-binding protein [Xylanibacterium ulmi]
MGSDTILEAVDITVRFGGVVALDAVSFRVATGAIHAIIGPNGAGKSTCFNAMTGVSPIASGQVRLDGERLDRLPGRRIVARGVARTFQNVVLPESLTVADALRVGRHHRTRAGLLATALGLPSARSERRADDAMVRDLAQLLGLADRLDDPASSLPLGLRKKAEIARALCAEPRLLLLDEPVAGLNDAESQELGDKIRECRERFGLTVLLVEHDMELVMRVSDHVTVLQSGCVIADDRPEGVQRDPAVISAYLGAEVTEPTAPEREAITGG